MLCNITTRRGHHGNAYKNGRGRCEDNLGLELLPAGDADAHYSLALAVHQEGKETESRPEFEKALAIGPELSNAPTP